MQIENQNIPESFQIREPEALYEMEMQRLWDKLPNGARLVLADNSRMTVVSRGEWNREAGPDFREGSNDLYTAYRNYCIQTNEFVRSTADFYGELEKMGCTRFVEKRKRYFKGIRLNAENGDFTGILD